MRATVICVAGTGQGSIAICEADGQEGCVVFSVDKGGPWKDMDEPKRGEQIIVEGLHPGGQGIWVPTSAYPLPAEPPVAAIRPSTIGLGRDV